MWQQQLFKEKAMTERIVFIEGKQVNLCLPHKGDMLQITRWVNRQDIQQHLHAYQPLSLEAEEVWFQRITQNHAHQRDYVFFLETKQAHTLIGTMGIHNIDYRNGHATTGAVLGEPSAQGKGYGTDAKMHLLHWAFTVLNLRKVSSNVLASNPRSIRYLEKTGYRIVGTRKAHSLMTGEFVDEHVLEVFRDDFMQLWQQYQKVS